MLAKDANGQCWRMNKFICLYHSQDYIQQDIDTVLHFPLSFQDFNHRTARTLNKDCELQWPPKPTQSPSASHTAMFPSNQATPSSASATAPLMQEPAKASSRLPSRETGRTNYSELSLQVGNSHGEFRFTLSRRFTPAAATPEAAHHPPPAQQEPRLCGQRFWILIHLSTKL